MGVADLVLLFSLVRANENAQAILTTAAKATMLNDQARPDLFVERSGPRRLTSQLYRPTMTRCLVFFG